ncbi:MAG: hypothetical protein WBD22_15310 [Pyrinomonadaceae bacterium]
MEIEVLESILERGGAGKVVRTQTTFLEIIIEASINSFSAAVKFRIHYDRKHEFALRYREFSSIRLEGTHPLLLQYKEPLCGLQLISEVKDKRCFLDELKIATVDVFGGWRTADEYCFMPPEKFIEKSYGILMIAPKSYAESVISAGARCGVTLTADDDGCPRQPNAKVLLLNDMYVVADDFRIEDLDTR